MLKKQLINKMLLVTAVLSAFAVQTAFAATVELNLDKAVNLALINNSTVKISAAELAGAKAGKDQAKSARWGSVSASSSYTHSGTVSSKYANGLSLALPLYSGGALSGAIDKASNNYVYYQYGMDEAYQATKLSATTGYYSVLEAANTVALDKESVKQLAEHLKNTQAQFNVGVVAKIDVLRSQVALANAEQVLTQAENAYDVAVANLNKIIGLPMSSELSVSEGLGYKKYNNDLDYCLTYAMSNRPEIKQATAYVDMAKASQKIANAGNMPVVEGTASKGWYTGSAADASNDWTVGLTFSMNIWDYGVTAAKVAGAKADVVNAQETYNQTIDSVQLAVRTYYLSLREAEKRISTTSLAIAEAEEAYKIAVVQYQAGVGTNTDVIDAQVALTTAKNNYIQALYDYNTSHAQLEKAMGVAVVVN